MAKQKQLSSEIYGDYLSTSLFVHLPDVRSGTSIMTASSLHARSMQIAVTVFEEPVCAGFCALAPLLSTGDPRPCI